MARSIARKGNDAVSNISISSTKLRIVLSILAKSLSFLRSRSEKSEQLEEKHALELVWISWPISGPVFRSKINIVISDMIVSRIANIVAIKIEIRRASRVEHIIANWITNRTANRMDIFHIDMNMNYVTACDSRICHLSNPSFLIAWTRKWNRELQKAEVRL